MKTEMKAEMKTEIKNEMKNELKNEVKYSIVCEYWMLYHTNILHHCFLNFCTTTLQKLAQAWPKCSKTWVWSMLVWTRKTRAQPRLTWPRF